MKTQTPKTELPPTQLRKAVLLDFHEVSRYGTWLPMQRLGGLFRKFTWLLLISLILGLFARDGFAQAIVNRTVKQPQDAKVTIAVGADIGKKVGQVQKSAQALKYPLLVGKLESKLIDAWEKSSSQGPGAAIQSLKAQNVSLAENGQDVPVIVSLAADAKLQEVETQLKSKGVAIVRSGPDTIKIVVPVAVLGDIAMMPGIQSVRAIKPPSAKNTTKTQGISATLANAWQAAGITGQNVKLAIVDDAFANLATLKAQDEIPATAVEVNYSATAMTSGTSSHGSACAETVYDMAPGVQMYLIKVDDPTDLIAAKDYCIANGIKIVSCSLGWDALNFHDGIAYANWFTTAANHPVTAVDAALANGILWVMAAGNEQNQQSTIDWRDGGTPDTLLDWNSSQLNYNVLYLNGSSTIPAGTVLDIYMTWNQWPTTSQDFDLLLLRNTGSGWTQVTNGYLGGWTGDDTQNGTTVPYPYEEIQNQTTVTAQYAMAVKSYGTTTSPTFILRYYAYDSSGVQQSSEPWYFGYGNYLTPAPGSISIPGDAASAFTVGALNYATYTTGTIEIFSSLGPNNRAYTGGSAVTKPDICGPDRTASVTYGSSFAGTSAATPHIAGLAALVKCAYPSYTVAQIKSYIESNGYDLGTAGKDNTYGSGAARLPTPPIFIYTVTFDAQSGTTPSPTSKTVTNGNTYGTLATTTRIGYTLAGWWTGTGGTGTQITSATTVALAAGQTLYAFWTPNSYTVTFDAQSGTTPSPTSKSVTYASTYGTLATTTRTGYTFAGWWTGTSGTGTQITSATTVTITAAQTLYANWTATNYTVTFDGQGGTTPSPTSKSVTYASTYGTLATTTRTGYTLAGWWTGTNGTGTQITSATTVNITAPQTLYAKWTLLTTTHGTPYLWLDQYGLVTGGNYETADTGDKDGDGYTAWQEYVAGTVPTNRASVFKALITKSNGVPRVTWTPDLGTARVYTVQGRTNLNVGVWGTTNASSRFFRVNVGMP